MKLIVCLDDKNGFSFAKRRQSRDAVQLEKMLELVGDCKLFVNEYTAKLFDSCPQNVVVCENPFQSADENSFCFAENIDIPTLDFEKIIIYRWNRHYPSDKKLPLELLNNKKLVSSTDFAGNSHEKITEEVYE